jgi:peptidoglycan/LPS O-acetylase OafA/YrhL
MKFNWIVGAFAAFAFVALMTATSVYPGAESWSAFGVFTALAIGFAIAAGRHDARLEEEKRIRDRQKTGGLPALLLLQDSSFVGSGGEGLEGGLLTFLVIGAVLVVAIGAFVWLRKNKRSGHLGT